MDGTRPLPQFRCEELEKSKLHHEWRDWRSSLERYFEANDITDQHKKRAKLLYLGGPQLDKIFMNLPEGNKFPLVATEKNYYDVAIAALNNYFQPMRQDILERHRLRQMKQLQGEKFSHYMVRLRQQAALCGLEKYSKKTQRVLVEIMITDVIVEGCLSNELRRRMLLKDRTLDEIEDIAASLEGVDAQIQDLTVKSNQTVEKVYMVKGKSTHKFSRERESSEQSFPKRVASRIGSNVVCFSCGRQGHISSSDSCPAKGKQCRNCGRVGHFESKCKLSKMRQQSSIQFPPHKKIRVVEEVNSEEPESNKVFYAFYSGNQSNVLEFKVGGISLELLVDSGADANMITVEAWEQLKLAGVRVLMSTKNTTRKFLSYGSNKPLTVRGMFTSEIEINDRVTVSEFYVVENGQKCLLGDKTAKKLEVLKVGVNVNQVEKVEPFACIKDVEVHIHMQPDIKPIVQPVRRLPIPLEAEVNQKLDDMLSRDIIEQKTGPTTWVSPLVVVAKANGGLRLCVDFRRVNQGVLREHHPMPVIEQILARLGGGAVWSKLDIKDSFLQVSVDAESRDILTFITTKGLFRFKRLPFGLITAPEIFQKVIDEILCGCDGTHWYLDDIFVVGRNIEEHNTRLEKVMKRLEGRGVQLNWDKCLFRADEVEFLGNKITRSGIAPSDTKVAAITSFRRPTSDSEVRSFLGLANYLNKFIPNLATLDEPLRALIKKGVRFFWERSHEKAFQIIKRAMSDVKKLGFYNVDDKTAVIADASPIGLGAMLVQTNKYGEERVISFASKSLTETEKRYCQTEKEALALVWAVEKFQFYLLGKKFNLVTDCKALSFLFSPKSRPCSRIERWVLRLQCFDYDIVHIRGDQTAADALSRLSISIPEPFDSAEEIIVHHIAAVNATTVAVTWSELLDATRDDADIANIFKCLDNETIDLLPVAYRIISVELCNVGGVLLRGDRIVVPASLRNRIISTAHDGHPGVNLMKSHLRTAVWWPKMDADVESFVKNCRGCVLVSAPDVPEPMLRKELPSGPWEDISIDYLGPLPDGQYLLVVVDCYSRYLEICEITCTDSKNTIENLKKIFSRFGLPSLIKADNGPQFASQEFRTFCEEHGIKLVNTIPYWPQMNGQVERQNRSILKRLRIAQELGKDWRDELYKYLLIYHATNHSVTGQPPSKLMFGRCMKSKLPRIPTHIDDEAIRDEDKIKKQMGKEYADKKRRAEYSDIKEGDRVFVKRMRKDHKLQADYSPEEFQVQKKVGSDVVVRSESGVEFRRNVTHLKRVPNKSVEPETSSHRSSPKDSTHTSNSSEIVEESCRSKRQRSEPVKFQDYMSH
ncbi:uncharacterized protein K02A2.6-like [Toxorhynchites rutilus septentrionalis]|uniref:uncharacterized protein K02A2.6-like n=1 Tax=Toxorhynchites rutilus septentrionalis TaxID=329112 RepID=UPI002479E666|nr:uncharacterized protein K02A2.6-like [Toxorhynchites rutilus septentrionalis]